MNNEMIHLLVRKSRGNYINKLDSLVTGYEGEEDFARIVRQYLPHRSLFLTNFIFEQPSYAQIDGILLMSDRIHLYEVKNYDAHCSITEGKLYYNHRHINHNPIQQIERATDYFRNILIQNKLNISLQPHLVLIHPFATLEQDDSVQIPILLRNQLRHHFQMIDSSMHSHPRYDPTTIHDILNYYQINDWHNYFEQHSFNLSDLRAGVYCTNCGSFYMEKTTYYFKCQHCHTSISKKAALDYLIQECAALTPGEVIKTKDLFYLIDQSLSPNWVYRMLNQKLDRVAYGTYVKPKLDPDFLNKLLGLYYRSVK